ncbi:MAG: sulfotransferase family 2 domain-containing protein [Candidatus Obscuribacterales bacterium]|nr:sulfotransferase family 2 domain-containing protein [Candidatus Obscuribacterales bacterium]
MCASSDSNVSKLLKEFPAVLYSPKLNQGFGASLNYALRNVTGDYVLFLDSNARLDRDFLAQVNHCLALENLDLQKLIVSGAEPYMSNNALPSLDFNNTIFPSGLFSTVKFDESTIDEYNEVDLVARATHADYRIVPCQKTKNFYSPSIERSENIISRESARIYVTSKHYVLTEQNLFKAIQYLLLSPFYLSKATRPHTFSILTATVQHWCFYIARLNRRIIKLVSILPIEIFNNRIARRYSSTCIMSKYNAIFIHIPKNAGTSIATALGLPDKSGHHWSASHYRLLLGTLYKKFFKFAFVRHPWERFLSNYWYAKAEYNYFHSPSDLHKDHELLKHASLLDCAQYLIAGKLQHGASGQPPYEKDPCCHWSPQYKWLYDNKDQCIVDWIGKVEKIETDLTELSKRLNQRIELLHLNTSHRQHNVDWTEDNRRAYKLVRDYYAKDFELFGYEDIDNNSK